jgi:effector-binding domain-containing protein
MRYALLLVLFAAAAHAQSTKQVAPFKYVCLEHTGPYVDYAKVLAQYRKLAPKLKAPIQTIYWNSPLYVKPAELRWDVGQKLEAGDPTTFKAPLTVKKFAFGRVATTNHTGSYLTTYASINALYAWIEKQKEKTIGGPCVEIYLDLDDASIPADKKTTEIWIPIE